MSTATRDPRQAMYEIAEAIAPSWERRRAEVEEVAAPMREWMLHELRPGPGDTLLELAAGVGDTGFEALALAGDGSRLITTDFSPAMLAGARRRGTELGVDNVDYRVMDAERIELPDDSVDGVLCRFGYMLMPDPAAALAETRRVLREGGRLTLAVWGAMERNPMFGIAAVSLHQRGHLEPPPPGAPGPFTMANPDHTAGLLRGAGFRETRTEEVPGRLVVQDVDEYLGLIADTSGPIGLMLAGLAEPARSVVRADAEDSLRRFAAGGGYEIPCVALCAVAW